ncbi:MAG: secretin N-terminal domain-containing protein [Bacteroidia bacterium]
MRKFYPRSILFSFLFLAVSLTSLGQDRFSELELKLRELSKKSPGLLENVEVSVNNATIQEFLRGMAATYNLNINVDNTLTVKISNAFSNVNVIDVFIFMCKNYDMDITFTGPIMSFVKYVPPLAEPPKLQPRIIKITYDSINDLLNFDLKDDTLFLVAKEITKVTGKNVAVAPELNNKVVNGFIQNMSFGSAMLSFAYANDLKVTPTDDNVFLIDKKDKEPQVPLKSQNDKNGTKNSTGVNGLDITVQSDTLISVDANNVPLVDIINTVCGQLKRNYYLFSEIKGNASLHVTNATFEDFLKYLLNATDYTFKRIDGIILFGDRNIEGLRQTKLMQLKYRTAEKIIDVIPAELKKSVDIKAFPDLNSVIMSGSQPKIEEIETFLREVDRVVPVVVIEVLIVDVRNTRTVSSGIQAGLGDKPAPQTKGTVLSGVDMSLSSSSINNIISGINGLGVVNLGKVTPNFYLNIKLLEEQGYLKLRSTPKLATLNGHEAKLSIGRTEYYQESSTTILGSVTAGSQTSISYKPINADLALSINPMVSGDEQITLDIGVKQSNFTERISPTAPPGTITRDFQSMIRVKNEEMIILGGLEENTSNDSGSGIPFLSRIPVIKWFFSTRTKTKGDNKLTIFIKPTVIY